MTSTVGGGGGPQKADKRKKVAGILYVTEKSENFADVI